MLCGGFFSGSETGLYCLSRLRLRVRSERGDPSARALERLVARPRRAISTILVGTNLCVYLATALGTHMLFRRGLGDRAELYAGLFMPPVLLVIGDIIPKTLMQRHADGAMYRAVWPLWVAQVLFYPLAWALRGASALPHLLFGKRASVRAPALTPESLAHFFAEGTRQGVLSGFQRSAAMNIMRLRQVPVSDVMTPLSDAVMVARDASAQELMDLLRRERYSRFPVFADAPEDIVGFVNVLDVVSAGDSAPRVADIIREPMRVLRDVPVTEALHMMRRGRSPLAVVLEAEGGPALGIVTHKDLVEEIVGELTAW